RLLHTADWHLGLRLYRKEIFEEHRYFFNWLVTLIRERNVDVLMISGDVFDQANPSNEARSLYYEFLKQLIDINCKVIITGGNHDSPGILNAPREILRMLDVHIVGNMCEHTTDEIVELKDRSGELKAVVAAIPYLREPDIHALTREGEYEDKRQQVRDAIRRHYDDVAEACKDYHVPVIAMGHLYAAGSSTSDSERLIQMGNQSPVAADDFHEKYNYVALGHIHRPQYIAGQKHIRYSGSPVPLSFSERSDKKIVVELNIENGEIAQLEHEVPVFRKLVRFKGTLEEVKREVEDYKEESIVKAFGELHIEEEKMNPAIYGDAARFVADFNSEYIDILNYGITINEEGPRMTEIAEEGTALREIQPLEVLNRMMESGGMSAENQEMVRMAFLELLDMEDEMEEE
ncbi:MAG TPA: exonuclease subunit SbcD, partial [Chitinophagaceae bacterium]|nr:exonuclease subunit SbcD [Chitinophagaceae bacterium]